MVGIPNASNQVGTTEPTIQRPPSPSREVEEASSILQVDSCSEDSDVESYAASIYPTTRKYRSIPRSYDLESMTSTRSLYEKEMDYTMENGRRYIGNYFAPCDLTEQDRLHIAHQILLRLFNNELTTVPLENTGYWYRVTTPFFHHITTS